MSERSPRSGAGAASGPGTQTGEVIRECAGAEETEAFAAELAANALAPGDIVLLHGDLGAGKTTFVRGATRGLGIEEPVTSPTFTIGQLYEGRTPVAHIDLYRLGEGRSLALADEVPGLLDDYLDPEAICFVEWPGLLGPGDLPAGRRLHAITIEIVGEPWAARRLIRVAAPEPS